MGKVRIFCGTWNVNARSPPPKVDLEDWLCKSPSAPDIVAISLQELVPLSDVKNYIQTKKGEEMCETWSSRLIQCLENYAPYERAKYSLVAMSHLIGIMSLVLVRTEHSSRVSKVMIGYSAVGRFGVLGNKGAVGIRFRLEVGKHKFKNICFVGSHFTAHRGEVSKRNADFADIMDRMTFHPIDSGLSGPFLSRAAIPLEQIVENNSSKLPGGVSIGASLKAKVSRGRKGTEMESEEVHSFVHEADLIAASVGKDLPYLRIESHDLVFWLGDLNYRIDTVTWQDVLESIKQKDVTQLLNHDQLRAEKKANRVFQGFEEGVIKFNPTYKFVPGTNQYDTKEESGSNSSKKKKVRVPAWCDRILWRCSNERSSNQTQQCSYFSVPDLCLSDHKPVGAEFILPFVELLSSKSKDVAAEGAAIQTRSPRHSRAASIVKKGFGWSATSSPLSPQGQSKQQQLDEKRSSASLSDIADSIEAKDLAVVHAATAGIPVWDGDVNDRSSMSSSSSSSAAQRRVSHISEEQEGKDDFDILQSVCVVETYTSTSPEELDLQVGELLELLPDEKIEVLDGWLLGRKVRDGRSGYFRADMVIPLGAVQTKYDKETDKNGPRKATALRYHRKKIERSLEKQSIDDQQDSEEDGEPSGDDVENQGGAFSTGMDLARCLMRRVQNILLGQSRSLATRKTWSMKYFGQAPFSSVVACEDYEASEADELSFSMGDVIEVVSLCPDQVSASGPVWFVGKRVEDGQQGLVNLRLCQPNQ